jgi:steroid delta-isomerase-like uncharacterized protein/uncharacterized protein (TIGR02246 family)
MILVATTFGLAAAAAALAPAPVPSPVPENREPVATLAEMVRAVNAGDARAYASLYAPDAVLTIQGGDVLTGRQAIEDYETGLLREFPGVRLGFDTIWQQESLVVVHYAVSGQATGGGKMGHEGLLFYRFLQSGLIFEERRYLDSLTPMAQLGALGAVPARSVPAVPARPKVVTVEGEMDEHGLQNAALAKASLAALDPSGHEAFLSAVADDVVVDELVEPRPFVGKDGVRAWLDRWTRAVSGAKSELALILIAGDTVVLETVLSGTLDGPLGPVSASGKPFTVHRAAIVETKNGTIARITAFMNGKELAQAVGQWPPAAK